LLTLAHRRAVDRVRAEQAATTRESRYGAANVEPATDVVADSAILRDERRQVGQCLGALTDVQRECIELAYYATAAAAVIGLGAVGVGLALRPAETPSIAAQVVVAPDVRTVSGQIPSGGTATVLFSREKDAGVLVMNNVAPPEPGTVYQMWLLGDKGATSAGTMDAKAVAPSTTAVLPGLANSTALAFTVEPGNGSTHPTGPIFAELSLTR
jgi:anti-sigma-K factor RskA